MTNRSTGFTYRDIHSSYYDLRIEHIETPRPEKKEIRDKVPHMNGEYDFSFISGKQKYENRFITFNCFVLIPPDVKQFQLQREITNWLEGTGWNTLTFDYEEGYEYKAKCMDVIPEPDILKRRLNVTIKFECEPFAINVYDGSEWL